MPRFPEFVSAIAGFAARQRDVRARLRTERMILDLPREIRKDIGWPDAWRTPDAGPSRRRSA